MYIKHHTKGIVLSSSANGDDGRRVSVFTEKFGLINAKVQGSRNAKSKLRSNVQNFSYGEYSLVRGRNGWKVVSARSEKNFFEVFRTCPEKMKIVANVLNLIKKLVSEEIILPADNSLFVVISNFLNFLVVAKERDIVLAECLTLIRVLYVLGYMSCDPEPSLSVLSTEISTSHLSAIAPIHTRLVSLINESLKTI